jgi:putative tryptophan/tyrosine transport system substrate-binding protein
MMRRREFITLLGGAAAAWPLGARAQQQPGQMRRIGVFMSTAENDVESKARVAAFLQGLQQLGWIDGRNVRIDIRWPAGDTERIRRYAAEIRHAGAGRHSGYWRDRAFVAAGDP